MSEWGQIEGDDLSDAELAAAQRLLLQHPDMKVSKGFAGCTSYVQRRLGIGYNRATRIVEYFEALRIITSPDRYGARHLGPAAEDATPSLPTAGEG